MGSKNISSMVTTNCRGLNPRGKPALRKSKSVEVGVYLQKGDHDGVFVKVDCDHAHPHNYGCNLSNCKMECSFQGLFPVITPKPLENY